MQSALNRVQRWCEVHGLLVNPDKTEMVLFTRRRTLPGLIPIVFFGKELERTNKVKHPGVVLDQWSSGNTLACGARGPRFALRCGQKFVFSRKSLRYAAFGTGCTLTAVPRSTQPSTLRGTVNEYQPYG